MGDKKEGKECSCGGCNSVANANIIPLSALLGAKEEYPLQKKACAGCGASKT